MSDAPEFSTLEAELNLMVRSMKHQLFSQISSETEVYVAINLEANQALVPDHLKQSNDGSLVLKFSPRYGPKLEILEEGVAQNLKFRGEDFEVFASWDSIYAIWEVSKTKQPSTVWQAPKALRPKGPLSVTMGDMEVVVSQEGEVDFVQYIH